MNNHQRLTEPHRPNMSQRRLLGDARREATATSHFLASKRRRLGPVDDDAEEDENNPADTRALDDNDVAVFADAVYEKDDVEADEIYAMVDSRMKSRRQKQREDRIQLELKKYRDANPTVRQQFADLKTNLSTVSSDQWASIPDMGDYSVKKQKFKKFTPAPDSLLEKARQESAVVAAEPSTAGTATDLASIGAGRTSVLGHKLDVASTSLSGHVNVDANGYLNQLAGVKVSTDTEIGDIKKARLLLKSVTSTNPNHAPGWIAAARLEETSGKMTTARKIILEGCRKCYQEEDVWLEAARLHTKNMGLRVLAQAVKRLPKSVKIWLYAAALEEEPSMKKRVLRKALEIIPRSTELWKAAVELEQSTGARILLSRAVECAPMSVDLWLAYARLVPYKMSKQVLARARKAVPKNATLYVTEAQLEEAQHGAFCAEIEEIMRDAVQVLSNNSDSILRKTWLEEAQNADRGGFPGTVRSIVANSIGLGVKKEDREKAWISDADEMEGKGFKEVAGAIYCHLTNIFSSREDLWMMYADFERRCEDIEKQEEVLSKAVKACPQAEVLWLMLAKDKWKNGSVDEARSVLQCAFQAKPNSQLVWLAAAKLETQTGKFEMARDLLEKARKQAGCAKMYMKSALLERQVGRRRQERELLEQGIELYPKDEKLWLMLVQWHERNIDNKQADVDMEEQGESETKEGKMGVCKLQNASEVYKTGLLNCSKCVYLWIGYGRQEERSGAMSKARAILERGRERCKGTADMDVLWRECVYLEVRDSKMTAAQSILSRGLQECKHSGKLWTLSLGLEGRNGQKSKSVDAIKHCPQDGEVITEVAKYIWRTGKIEKARTWLKRSVEVDGDVGDSWATLVCFERAHGSEEEVREVEKMAVRADPRKGDIWIAVRKKVGNETWSTLEILRKVASLVGKKPNVTGIYQV